MGEQQQGSTLFARQCSVLLHIQIFALTTVTKCHCLGAPCILTCCRGSVVSPPAWKRLFRSSTPSRPKACAKRWRSARSVKCSRLEMRYCKIMMTSNRTAAVYTEEPVRMFESAPGEPRRRCASSRFCACPQKRSQPHVPCGEKFKASVPYTRLT